MEQVEKKVLTASRFIPEGLVFLSPGQKIKIVRVPNFWPWTDILSQISRGIGLEIKCSVNAVCLESS